MFFIILTIFNFNKLEFNDFNDNSNITNPILLETTGPNFYWGYNDLPVCISELEQYNPRLCSDGAGGVFVVWQDYRSGTDYDVYCQRINSSGHIMWADNGVVISNEIDWQNNPEICSDGNGGAIITWVDDRNSYADIYAQRIDKNGNCLWTQNGIVICNYSGDQTFPKICSDGNGGAIITWFDYRNTLNGAIYAQKVDSNGNLQWNSNGIVINNVNYDSWMPEWDTLIINSDNNSGAFIVWQDNRSGTNWDLYVQHINSTGDVQWTPNGTIVCNANNDQIWPRVCSDSNGGIIITWEDHRSGIYSDIYAQRINSTGDPLWSANGTIICNANENQFVPNIEKDGNGGAYIIWVDNRSSTDRDIYIQRVRSNGTIIWSNNGTLICNANNYQYWPTITTDLANNALITWVDHRNNDNDDIYCQKVDLNGTILWDNNGTSVATMPADQIGFSSIHDGNNGLIVAWRDHKNDFKGDICTIKINSSGNLEWALDKSGIEVYVGAGDHEEPKTCISDNGSVIVVWRYDKGDNNKDLFAQKINSTGHLLWGENGVVITLKNGGYTSDDEHNFEICSDGSGGVIVAWSNSDIYAQRINATGHIQWKPNGTIICNETNDQKHVAICSDGLGGAIISWADGREGINDYNIYSQRISSNGTILWIKNGVIICNEKDYQTSPKMCTDGSNGAIIAWCDDRYSFWGDWYVYAQRINSTGSTLWSQNGTQIGRRYVGMPFGEIISDGNGNAIITWLGQFKEIYSQKLNSLGSKMWGSDIVLNNLTNRLPKSCSDENGGLIVIWSNWEKGNNDILIQHVNSNGIILWGVNGIPIVNETHDQDDYYIYSDGKGGALTVWSDYRTSITNIYTQHVNFDGNFTWTFNGVPIYQKNYIQMNSSAVFDGNGNAFITWVDYRRGDKDIFAQYIKNLNPESNHPVDINTSAFGNETIQWKLTDDYLNGYYRIWANNSEDISYIWINWTPWRNNSNLIIPINRSKPGLYNYTIEYKDLFGLFGTPDTVFINISDNSPTSNSPNNFSTTAHGNETIQWILLDDYGTGSYRVWANDTNDNYYVWVNWTPWSNNTALNIPINRSAPGVFNYTIEFNDSINQFGDPDSVIVTILDSAPTSNHPIDFSTNANGSETIQWILLDDYGTGSYRVWVNDTNNYYYIWVNWTPWSNNTALNIPINRSVPGIFNYTIEFNDSINQFGDPDSVIVTVLDSAPTSNHPIDFSTNANGAETIQWILLDDYGTGSYRVWVNDTNNNYYVWVSWTPWSNNTALNVIINRSAPGFFNYTILHY
ncbi:MAG: hypothetical protein ACTSPY_17875 [Candidatus Helarchaeota archaeon]